MEHEQGTCAKGRKQPHCGRLTSRQWLSLVLMGAMTVLLGGTAGSILGGDPQDPGEKKAERGPQKVKTDLFGDPLPAGAIARLGTNRLRHAAQVNSVVFSPDSKLLASGSHDKTVRLWEVATGKELRRLEGHQGAILALALSPDGKVLASGGEDRTTRLWDMATGKEVRRLQTSIVHSIAFSPDGKTVASAGGDLELWKVATGQKLFQLKGHEGWVDAVTFLPDGKALASGGGDKTIRIWDIGTGRTIGQLQGHQDVVESIAVSPDGKTLASTGSDNTVRLWDVGTGRELRQLQGPESRGTSVTFSSNGKIVAATELQMVRLWEVATGKPLRKLRSPLPMLHMSGAWSPDRKIFASGGTDGIICLWNLTTGQLMPPFLGTQGQVGAVAFSPDAKTIASAGSTAVTVWKATTGEPLHRIKGSSGQFFATFAPDGRTLITDGGEGVCLPSGTAQRGSVFKPSTERLRGWMPWYFRQTVRS